jgi:aspartyl-tRNA(Asn)/glutamyl-tRNA(Gln) amidotransferase subunit B
LLIEIINLIKLKKISSTQAKIVFLECFKSKKKTDLVIKELGFENKISEEEIRTILKKYKDNNLEMISIYKTNPEKVLRYFIGLLMKETKGLADPILANSILKKILN